MKVRKGKMENENENENENEVVIDSVKVENKLRNLLFKNKKNIGKRNKSAEKRKKIKFNLD